MSETRQLDIFIPEELKPKKQSTTSLTKEGYALNAQVFLQGGRIVYRTTLSFYDVKTLLTYTKEKPTDHQEMIEDVTDLKNRYLNPKRAAELKQYVLGQPNSFILPGLTVMVDHALPFKSIIPSYDGLLELFHKNDFPDLHKNPEMIKEAIDRYGQPLFGQIIIPVDKHGHLAVELDTGDGNHRTKAIHDIVEKHGASNPSFYIGCDFYIESHVDQRREMFVDLNNATPIERSIYNILKGKDPLSIAAKEIAGIDSDNHVVQHLKHHYAGYVGFSPVDNMGAHSKFTLTFNILKNMISYIALDQDNAEKGFKKDFPAHGSSYQYLLSFTSKYLRAIFNNVAPFAEIKGDLESVPALRADYVSLSGAGLYVMARVGHFGFINNLNPEKLAEKIATLNWMRENEQSIFTGGILSTSGRISNTRTALDTSTERILAEIGIIRQ